MYIAPQRIQISKKKFICDFPDSVIFFVWLIDMSETKMVIIYVLIFYRSFPIYFLRAAQLFSHLKCVPQILLSYAKW